MFEMLDMNFLGRFLINTITLLVLVKYCYYRRTPNRDFLFSFFLFGTGVFIVSFLLHGVQVSMGFAFGLFAIFSMLRYRTEAMSIKSMTYLFLVITVSLLSSVGQTRPMELVLLNALICACTGLAESKLLTPRLSEQIVLYEKIENIRPQNRNQLLDDLHVRTGLEIQNVLIDKIDFLKDTARLRVFYVAEAYDLFVPESSNPIMQFFKKGKRSQDTASALFPALIIGVILFSPFIINVQSALSSQNINPQSNTLEDSVKILQVMAGVQHGDGAGYKDMNGDGKVGMADIVGILQARTGLRRQQEINPSYPVVDTGQIKYYDDSMEITCPQSGGAFYGQDAAYTGSQPTYTDNGDGTVTDNHTGLMWQQTPGDKMSYDEAVAGAGSFNLAGYDDWRLPTVKELYSLILFSGMDPSGMQGEDTTGLIPFMDTDYFNFKYGDPDTGERIIDSQWATSTEYVNTTMGGNRTMFGVNFADGRIKGYPINNKTYFVIYVRGNTAYGINNFSENNDGTVTDKSTGLMWMQQDSGYFSAGDNHDGAMSWEQALEWAENLEYAGYSDWRLPNAKELQSIVDYTRSPATTGSAAIDPVFSTSVIIDEGGNTNYPFFWSATTHANAHNGANAVYVAFGEALGWMRNPFGDYTLMDVHGAGAQRSDPKTGNPADYPYGHGPQGDVIRIYNYVRCVR